jgi:hypothetical protein
MNRIFITLLLVFTLFNISLGLAQIPNADFEDWTNSGGHDSPSQWSTPDPKTMGMGMFTCEKGIPGWSGNSYLKLTSTSMGAMGVIPGIAVCGMMDMNTLKPKSGFPFTERPKSLTGMWQHMIFGNSQGFISVLLTKWDNTLHKRDTISFTIKTLSGMAMGWESFSFDLKYQSVSNPDSCIIFMSASGSQPTNKDYLWVDKLEFKGITSINPFIDFDPKSYVCIFPNPLKDELNFTLGVNTNSQVNFQLVDLNGKTLYKEEWEEIQAGNTQNISLPNLAKGIYVIKFSSLRGILTQRIIVQ